MNSKEQHKNTDKTVDQNQSVVKDAILWWEKKRWIYNLLIIAVTSLVVYDFWEFPMRGIIGGNQIVFEAFLIVLGANLFYALGWGLELTAHYILSSKCLHPIARWSLFILGTLATFFMIAMYFTLRLDVIFA
ncbi:MAG: hypothetical protein GQ574_07090 [Crocinitomix sp.]|nr:hypothetical protein [Crocinitomix sp.]